MEEILVDLRQEQESLDRLLQSLDERSWGLPTPAEGWTVRDSISHLAHIDEVALAVLGGDRSPLETAARMRGGFNAIGLRRGRSMRPKEVFLWWREARQGLLKALSRCDPRERLPWFARPMSARSFATARLMETWAHGLDCYEAVGAECPDTDRLRHIALLAYLARPYAYGIHGLDPPESPLRVDLELPSGRPWSAGPPDAQDRIEGSAGEFCRVAVRRRHWRDTSLVARGEEARRFLEIVQAYAGPPGSGRGPQRGPGHGFPPAQGGPPFSSSGGEE
jgi:uncharacterized protein (TIGR03084 family)